MKRLPPFTLSVLALVALGACAGPVEPKRPYFVVGCAEDKPEEGGCLPDLAYLDAENGTFDMNNVGTGASCDPENDPSFCDLREMNGYEYGIVLEVINHLPPDIKSWAIEVFM